MARRIIFWLLIVAFIWFIVVRLTEIKMVARTLAEGKWIWIVAAAVVQAGYFLTYTRLYQCAFSVVGIREQFRHLLAVMMAASFINIVVPTGTAGSTLFVDDAVRSGQSPVRATVGVLLALIADYAALSVVVLIGLFDLFRRHDLMTYQIVASSILLLLILALSTGPVLSLWKPDALSRVLGWIQRTVCRVSRLFGWRSPLADDWAEGLSKQFSEVAGAIKGHPRDLRELLGLSIGAHVVALVSLYFVFVAFNQQIALGPLIAGFAMGLVFYVVSITPGGIGVVEGVIALVYASLGVPAARAAIIAIAFRGLSFWLPLLVGFIVLRVTGSFSSRRSAS